MKNVLEYTEPEVSKERNKTEEMKLHEDRIALIIQKRKEEQLKAIYEKRKINDQIVVFEEVGNMDLLNLTFRDIYTLGEGETITKEEIVLKSPYRIYFEEEALNLDQLIYLFFLDLEGGHIGKSLKRMGISRHTLTKWRNQNLVFNEIISDSQEFLIDTAEVTLAKAVENGDVKAAQFILETQGKNRGYGKHQTISTEDTTVVVGFEFINVNEGMPMIEGEISEVGED